MSNASIGTVFQTSTTIHDDRQTSSLASVFDSSNLDAVLCSADLDSLRSSGVGGLGGDIRNGCECFTGGGQHDVDYIKSRERMGKRDKKQNTNPSVWNWVKKKRLFQTPLYPGQKPACLAYQNNITSLTCRLSGVWPFSTINSLGEKPYRERHDSVWVKVCRAVTFKDAPPFQLVIIVIVFFFLLTSVLNRAGVGFFLGGVCWDNGSKVVRFQSPPTIFRKGTKITRIANSFAFLFPFNITNLQSWPRAIHHLLMEKSRLYVE